MKKILLSIFVLAGISASAQVKVGDNPTTINANSVLEIESTNKGMLLPRVALTGTANVAPLAAHVAGMTVYNTATAGDVTPGYYYNDGAKWVRLADTATDKQLGTDNQTIPAATNRNITLSDGITSKLNISPAGGEASISVLNLIGGNGGASTGITIANNYTDNTVKFANLKAPQFANPNPPVQMISSVNTATSNVLWIGGNNSSSQASPSEIAFRVDGDTDFTNSSNTSGINAMYIQGVTGNVGIGTTTPTEKLDVNGNVRVRSLPLGSSDSILVADGTGVLGYRTDMVTTASDNHLGDSNQVIPAATNRNITLGDAQTTKLNIAPAGQEPSISTLNVIGGNGGANSGILLGSNYTDNGLKYGVVKTAQFVNANPPAMAFTQLNTATSNLLWIGGNNSSSQASPSQIAFRVDGDNDLTNSSNTSGINAMYIQGVTGNVGIGTTAPSSKLQVVGLTVHANNAAAITAGLTAGAFYHNGDGVVRVVF